MGLPGLPTGIDAQILKMEDRLAQIERLLRRLPDAGQLIELTELIENPFNFQPTRIYQLEDSTYTTSAGTELTILTITVPAHAYATKQYAMAQFGFSLSVAADQYACRIREDSISGTIIGNAATEADAATTTRTIPIIYATEVSVAAATTKDYVLTIRRTLGTGVASGLGSTAETGIKVIVLPDVA